MAGSLFADDFCRGLGAVISLKFAFEGANVAINYVTSRQRAEVIAEQIKKEYGGKVVLVQGVSETALHHEHE